ncbi:hypothetical protein [Arsenicicoccus dermatophilus]|uniref:hypothetical protein n=1 Tax=Arsenicicoccus dermatophilus TaxID=1076331 RepID=UPI0039174B3E
MHLTIWAYLTTAGRVLHLDEDTATMMAGWDPDETWWLTDVEVAAEPVRWHRTGNTGLGWRREPGPVS